LAAGIAAGWPTRYPRAKMGRCLLERLIYEQLLIANTQLQVIRRILAALAIGGLIFFIRSLDVPWVAFGIWAAKLVGISVG
jgi:hypothetical protein